MKSIKARKPFFSFLILFILSVLLFIFLYFYSTYISDKKIREINNQRISGIKQTLMDVTEDIFFTDEIWFKKNSTAAALMTASLRELVYDGTYNGPEIFEDGAVVRINGDQIIFPEDFQGYFEDLDLTKPLAENEFAYMAIYHQTPEDEGDYVFVTPVPISGELYYLDWTSYEEYERDMQANLDQLNKDMVDMESAYGAQFIALTNSDGTIQYSSDTFGAFNNIDDLGISREDINNKNPTITYDGDVYFASYQSMPFLGEASTIIILINYENELPFLVNNNILVIFISTVVLSGMILWHYWTMQYVQKKPLTKDQYENYMPRNVRKKTFMIILSSSFVIFLVSIFYQSLGTLRKEAENNQNVLDIVDDYLQTMINEKSLHQQDNEDWNIYYAERTAELMAADPKLRTNTVLAAINDIIGSEYIMLFDSEGNEIVSSNSYIRFSLTDSGEIYKNFARLLLGVDTIVQAPQEDQTTGKYIQMTGSKVPMENDTFGALIIAGNSENSWEADDNNEIQNYVTRITPNGNLLVIADTKTNVILYSNDQDLIGYTTEYYGLITGERKDSAMDSFNILGRLYYGPFQESGSFRIFYLTKSDYIGKDSFSFAAVMTLGFAVIALLIALFSLSPYRTEHYKESVQILEETRHDSIMDMDEDYDDDDDEIDEDVLDFESQGIIKWWGKLRPDQKSRIFMRVVMGIILILTVIQLVNPQTGIYNSSIGFVLRGNWTRGVNLLAFAAIILLILAFAVYVCFKELVVGIMINFVNSKGETVLRLLASLVQYGVVVGLVFASLNYLGINTTVMIAGFSAFSLAISLGGKDLVADILAGIFIIFEDDFHVGDYIEVNGFKGIVQEIGVRSTKLLGLGDNIKIIGNQSVKNVLNMSKLNSWYTVELTISQDQPLAKIEEMLIKELPAIGAAIPEIISGPVYKGIWNISGGKATLAINSECRENNIRRVQRKLNHELLLLFNKYGYKFS